MNNLISLSVTKIEKLSNETLLAKKEELDELQAKLDELKDEVKAELTYRVHEAQDKNNDPTLKLQIGEKTVALVPVLVWGKVPVEFAEENDATKVVADTAKLKMLFHEGKDIPGLTTTERILVAKPKI